MYSPTKYIANTEHAAASCSSDLARLGRDTWPPRAAQFRGGKMGDKINIVIEKEIICSAKQILNY
jgi:hypothetical protein